MLPMQASKGLNIYYVGIFSSPNPGCAKLNLANFFCNTLALALAKFFPGENFPLYGIIVQWAGMIFYISMKLDINYVCIQLVVINSQCSNCCHVSHPLHNLSTMKTSR